MRRLREASIVGTLLLTLLVGTAVADTVPLNFTPIVSRTSGILPLPPLVWHVGGLPARLERDM